MRAIVDTGPLVAFFDRAERYHGWVTDRIEELEPPLLVCEPVLTEATYLLARYPPAPDALFALLRNGALSIAFHIEENVAALRTLSRNTVTRRSRLQTPVLFEWPRSMSSTPS